VSEAKRILQNAARWNKVQLPEKYRSSAKDDISSVYSNSDVGKDILKLDRPLMTKTEINKDHLKTKTEEIEGAAKQYTILDIFASPKLRVYALVMFYLW